VRFHDYEATDFGEDELAILVERPCLAGNDAVAAVAWLAPEGEKDLCGKVNRASRCARDESLTFPTTKNFRESFSRILKSALGQ
jgi:hypothetical protein